MKATKQKPEDDALSLVATATVAAAGAPIHNVRDAGIDDSSIHFCEVSAGSNGIIIRDSNRASGAETLAFFMNVPQNLRSIPYLLR